MQFARSRPHMAFILKMTPIDPGFEEIVKSKGPKSEHSLSVIRVALIYVTFL